MGESKHEDVRIVVVDDHPLYRDGVASTLNSQDGIQVVGRGSNAEEAVSLCTRELPDLVLMDIDMPGSGLSAVSDISKACPVTRIVMLTVSEDEESVLSAFRDGASAYVLKGVSGSELVRIVRSVLEGEIYVTPLLASRVLSEMSGNSSRKSESDPLKQLTDRERDILEGVASGNSNKEIAYDLNISEKTVKHYMTNIMQKLQARNRVEAAIVAHDAGIGSIQGSKSSS